MIFNEKYTFWEASWEAIDVINHFSPAAFEILSIFVF